MSALTETEAKTKWCPAARLPADHVGGGINRDSAGNFSRAMCIGSACMLWRFVDPMPKRRAGATVWSDVDEEDLSKGEPSRPADLPTSWVWVPITRDGEDNWDGGFWKEPLADAEAEFIRLVDERRGVCSLGGMPA